MPSGQQLSCLFAFDAFMGDISLFWRSEECGCFMSSKRVAMEFIWITRCRIECQPLLRYEMPSTKIACIKYWRQWNESKRKLLGYRSELIPWVSGCKWVIGGIRWTCLLHSTQQSFIRWCRGMCFKFQRGEAAGRSGKRTRHCGQGSSKARQGRI